MNERIRELARQAGALPTQDCGVPQWYIDEDEFEKFAELIVKECQHRVEQYINDCGEVSSMPNSVILEHFGDEE
jgi:hypothetical protein